MKAAAKKEVVDSGLAGGYCNSGMDLKYFPISIPTQE